jgi:NAD(P)-dependent dehydrogenase (short-subunit alcohol dehydrogenase family)
MRRALVTGGNRGLGLETCRQLLAKGWEVWLTARNVSEGEAAASSLGGKPVHAVPLNVSDPASAAELSRRLKQEGVMLDALVNNAGMLQRGIDLAIARETLDVNYRGPIQVTDALLARLTPSASIVMVSSGMGELDAFGREIRARLTDPGLRREDLDRLAEECLEGVKENSLAKRGFPQNVYSVSKGLLNGFTRVLSRELVPGDRRVNAVCPGWVQTRMGGGSAPRSVEQGAAGIVWAATLGTDGPKGVFLRDGEEIPW